MEMGMKEQVLSPAMEYGEEADLRSQMLGIGSDGRQGLGSGSEEYAVDEIFVLVSDGSNLFGNREDDMKIMGLENFRCSLLDPRGTRERLALWAVAVPAAVVARPLVMAAVAAFKMTAEGCRATHLDRGHDATLCS
jgi:hypothetical protein